MPASGANGKPIPKSTAKWETVNPDAPASASCTTEICPTKPVMTTSDSAITTPIRVLISAWRKSKGSTRNAAAHTIAAVIAGTARWLGRGTLGSRCSISSPRLGSALPRRNIAVMMIRKAISSLTPGSGTP